MTLYIVRDIPQDLLLGCSRAGIVPYKIEGNDIIFSFGIDRKSGEVSNFAGSPLHNEECLKGAVREFSEETLNAFGKFNINKLENCLAIYHEREIIIFLHCQWNLTQVLAIFNQNKVPTSEMKYLFFCSSTKLLRILYEQDESIMYDRVKIALVKAINNHGLFF
jgi:hypothetical protein